MAHALAWLQFHWLGPIIATVTFFVAGGVRWARGDRLPWWRKLLVIWTVALLLGVALHA